MTQGRCPLVGGGVCIKKSAQTFTLACADSNLIIHFKLVNPSFVVVVIYFWIPPTRSVFVFSYDAAIDVTIII